MIQRRQVIRMMERSRYEESSMKIILTMTMKGLMDINRGISPGQVGEVYNSKYLVLKNLDGGTFRPFVVSDSNDGETWR